MSSKVYEEKGPASWLAFFLNLLAALSLLGLMIITCIDVIGRYLLNSPLTGSTELIEMGLGIVIFAAFPVISWRNEQIVVDMLSKFTPLIINLIRTLLLNLVSAIAFYFLGDRIITLGQRSLSYGEESEFLAIPLGWTINFIGVMCWFAALALLTFGIYKAISCYHEHKAPQGGTLFR